MAEIDNSMLAELEQESRLMRARNARLEAEVTVLTEMVRVLSDKLAEMEAEQLELPQPKLTGKFSISAGKFKCTGCTGTWTNREDAKHHSCKEYQ